MSTIAERMLLLRGKTKQGVFAKLLEINPNTLRSYENGRTSPNQEFLERVCVQFSVSPAWLLLGKGPMKMDNTDATGAVQGEHTPRKDRANQALNATEEKIKSLQEQLLATREALQAQREATETYKETLRMERERFARYEAQVQNFENRKEHSPDSYASPPLGL